jgi:4-amino-4-deoxy-L-arabinose transferase-like glycosyltransferase
MKSRRPEPPGKTVARRPYLSDGRVLLIILGLHLLLSVLLFDPKLSVGGDNAHYLILAKSLVQGKYQDLFAPGSPPHTQYPPVFPLMMAPVVAVFGTSAVPPKILVMLCALGAVAMCYLILRRLVAGRDWILPLATFAFCPLLFDYAHDLYTEVPFLFLSLVAIYFFLRASVGNQDSELGIRDPKSKTPNPKSKTRPSLVFAGLAGLFAALAFLTRTMGVALVLAIVIAFAVRRRWAELGVAIVVMALLWLPWGLRDARLPHAGGYREQLLSRNMYDASSGYVTFGDLLKRITDNAGTYVLTTWSQVILPVFASAGKSVLGIFGVILTFLSLAGFVRRIREKGIGLLEWYAFLSVGLLLLWPNIWAGDRFLLPILPVLIWFLFQGLVWLGQIVRFRKLAPIVVALLVVLFGLVNARRAQAAVRSMSDYAHGDRFAGYEDAWRTYFEAGLWLRDHTEPNAIVVSRKPQFTYLMSGRQSFVYPYDSSQTRVLTVIDSLGGDYAYLETFFGQTMKYLYPVIRNHPDRFEQMTILGSKDLQLAIFRIKRPGEIRTPAEPTTRQTE